MQIKAAVLCGLFFAAGSGLLSGTPAWAQHTNKVFQIGTFDRSSAEFADGTPAHSVSFTVGQSDPAKDWYARQSVAVLSPEGQPAPASVDAAPRAIHFSLSDAPATAYKLHVAVLIESRSVPALRITINGKRGTYYLDPHLDYSNGDQWDSFDPVYSHADVEAVIPGSYLNKGDNVLTLQPVEDTAITGAALTYDAIALDRDTARHTQSAARIVPTIYYNQRGSELDELVDVYLPHSSPVKSGSVELAIGAQRYHQALSSNDDFGEAKLEFTVPEFPAKTQAQIAWSASGHRERTSAVIEPAKKWTLFLVPHIHLDVGYSDYQAKVAAIHSHAIDEAMDMTAQHPDFRFSLDGAWPLEQFLKTRTSTQQQRAIAAIEHKQLFVPANYANLLTGFPTAETLIRSLYPSANFSREHGTPFNYATITDVPSYSWSYASILSAAGVDELLGGSNNYRAPVLLQGRLKEDSPIWWQGPDGGKVLLWYSRHYQQMEMIFGRSPETAAGRDMVPVFLQMYTRPDYRANAAIIYGTQVENSDLVPAQAELAVKWNSLYAYPHIEYSGFHDALATIAKQFGSDIPTMHGDGGPYWEDGIASDSRYAAMERRNEARAPSAEKLATLSTLVNPLLAPDKSTLDSMWRNMVLMDEHTWDSYNSVSQPSSREAIEQLAIKDRYAVNARQQVDWLAKNSMAAIANSIAAAPGSLIVFNTLNWQRSAPVTIDIDKSDEIVDATTGQTAPVEVLKTFGESDHVRFIARDVPAVGYKFYKVRHAQSTQPQPQTTQTLTMESPYYRVTLDPATGAVSSIYDKQLQRELVDQKSSYRFGQYLYVTGADKAPNTVLQYSPVAPKPQLEVHAASQGSLVSITRTPDGWLARMKSSDTNTPAIVTEVRLFDHARKIEFVENVEKKKVYTKEAVYFAFPFAMDRPKFQYEIQNGVVDPSKDMYPGAGHEWFSAQHWVSVEQDGVSGTVMPLDASLITLGDIFRGLWPTQFGDRKGTIFSYAMNNYWDTNYAAGQGGRFQFRYVVTSATETDPASLSRIGWEEATPLEVNEVTPQDKATDAPRPLKSSEASLLDVQDPDLLLETWKPAEDGDGTILRFLDLGGASRTVTVHAPLLHLEKAWQTDAVERNQQPLPLVDDHSFQITAHPHEIITVRLVGNGVLKAPAL